MDAVLTVITRGNHGRSVNGDHERAEFGQLNERQWQGSQ